MYFQRGVLLPPPLGCDWLADLMFDRVGWCLRRGSFYFGAELGFCGVTYLAALACLAIQFSARSADFATFNRSA